MKGNTVVSLEDIREICLSFPGVTEDIKWEEHLCFNVGGKMFLISSPERVPVSVSFKATPEDFEALPQKIGFKPAPYLARNQWIYCEDIGLMTLTQWRIYLKNSYDLIFAKLPAKVRKALVS